MVSRNRAESNRWRLPVVHGLREGASSPEDGGRAGSFGLLHAFLRVPLFYKILIANALIVVSGAIAGTLITARLLRAAPDLSPLELVAPFALAGLVLSMTANAVLLRVALAPVKLLEETATRGQAGDLDARAPVSALADLELTHLTRVFNAMLDSISSYRARLREIASRALHAEEMERKRIARELHDDTAQRLAALHIRLRILRGLTNPEERDAALAEARRDVAKTLEGVRRHARGLRPPALDELGLVPAVDAHARMLAEATGLPIGVAADQLDDLLPPDAELALYRMVQEALSNVVRHARASHVDVRIQRGPDNVVVDVEDDGLGFSIGRVAQHGRSGMGLFGMRERAAYVGGDVAIDSEPGRSTRVRISVPSARV